MTGHISKDETLLIKGIAILFMIAHHVFIKEFYIDQPEFLQSFLATRIMIGMKSCVGLFTFLVGYGYYFSSNNSFAGKRIFRLLKQYWLILAITLCTVILNGGVYQS